MCVFDDNAGVYMWVMCLGADPWRADDQNKKENYPLDEARRMKLKKSKERSGD